MKPFSLIIHVDETGRPGFRFEPNEPHGVTETLQLLQIIGQIVGATQIGGNLREEKKDDRGTEA
jgi:hypothetical protein